MGKAEMSDRFVKPGSVVNSSEQCEPSSDITLTCARITNIKQKVIHSIHYPSLSILEIGFDGQFKTFVNVWAASASFF